MEVPVCFAAGRAFRCSATAPASALTHVVRSLAVAAFGAATIANPSSASGPLPSSKIPCLAVLLAKTANAGGTNRNKKIQLTARVIGLRGNSLPPKQPVPDFPF